MKYQFVPHARQELKLASVYYDQLSPALGDQFAFEVERTLARIVQFPKAWPLVTPIARRCRLRSFPYGIVYLTREEKIKIIAFMHLSRRPGYWSSRIEDSSNR